MTPLPISASDLTGKALDFAFHEALERAHLHQPVVEWQFAPPRKWQFDYCWPSRRLALEVEGGVWKKGGGRHNRGSGFLKDMEKYNAATVLGWRVVRVVPSKLCSVETLDMLKALLNPNPLTP